MSTLTPSAEERAVFVVPKDLLEFYSYEAVMELRAKATLEFRAAEAAAQQAERERCVQIAKAWANWSDENSAKKIAQAIRAEGETPAR